MKTMRFLFGMLLALSLFGVLMAQTEKNLGVALGDLCGTVKNVLAIGMLLLVVLAAVVYAVGQIMGAETRARASVWATAMFTGAIIGALIYILLPYIISVVMTGVNKDEWMNSCCKSPMDQADVDACATLMSST